MHRSSSPLRDFSPTSPRSSTASSKGSKRGSSNMICSDGRLLGVFFTGYLSKKSTKWRGMVSSSYVDRFVVLTSEALHWFKRERGYDLFGEEKGRVGLHHILKVGPTPTDDTQFEVSGTDKVIRTFKAQSQQSCDEWITAIQSAINNFNSASAKKIVKKNFKNFPEACQKIYEFS